MKTLRSLPPLAAALLTAAAAGGAGASALSYSISDSFATSSAATSDSLRVSSRASSPRPPQLAEGDYRIVDVAAVAGPPGRVQLTLQSLARDGDGLVLELPQAVVRDARLGSGDIVQARQRPYGIEFAHGEPFFLVVDDDWQRELQTRPVVL